MAGEDVSKESLSKRLEETSLARAKDAALCFSGAQPGSQGHHCLPHSSDGLNHTVMDMVSGHTSAPCHQHPTMAKGIRADPERVWGGGRERQEAQTDVCQRAQRELWLEEECGTAQLRGPMLITDNFSSIKQP